MRGLDAVEVGLVAGGGDGGSGEPVPRPRVSGWEWDILLRLLDEQERYRQEK